MDSDKAIDNSLKCIETTKQDNSKDPVNDVHGQDIQLKNPVQSEDLGRGASISPGIKYHIYN